MYQKYIGNPSEAIGKTLYVKLASGYVAGKVVLIMVRAVRSKEEGYGKQSIYNRQQWLLGY